MPCVPPAAPAGTVTLWLNCPPLTVACASSAPLEMSPPHSRSTVWPEAKPLPSTCTVWPGWANSGVTASV
jgi:hypothetical protein